MVANRGDEAMVEKYPPRISMNGVKASTRDDRSGKVSASVGAITLTTVKHLPERGDRSDAGDKASLPNFDR